MRDMVVVGASAGGVEALSKFVTELPPDLPASVMVVLHVPAHGTSVLPQILERRGHWPAVHAQSEQKLEYGKIYVAPPDRHLIVKPGYLLATRGPNENGHRPAVDPLFRSAARTYGPRVIGIILSGALDDGTAGMQAIKMRGGICIVQDPDDALYAGMPTSALENVAVDYQLPVADIGPLLGRLCLEPAPDEDAYPLSENMATETDMAELDDKAVAQPDRPGKPSGFSCPDCGGTLFELEEGELIRFRCRVGHAFSVETLLAHQADELEDALWVALRTLEENAALSRRLAERSRGRGNRQAASRFDEKAADAIQRADVVRNAIKHGLLEPGEDNSETLVETHRHT